MMLWLPLVDVVEVEVEEEGAEEVPQGQKEEGKMMSSALSGCHRDSGGSWRLQGHHQMVKALGHHQFCDMVVKEEHQVMKEGGCKEEKEVNQEGEGEMGKPLRSQY